MTPSDDALRGQDVSETVSDIFEGSLKIRVEDRQQDLFASGLLDSLAFVDLVAGLERRFGLTIDLLEVDLEDFQSFDSICRFVSDRREPGPVLDQAG